MELKIHIYQEIMVPLSSYYGDGVGLLFCFVMFFVLFCYVFCFVFYLVFFCGGGGMVGEIIVVYLCLH
jgi:hypothetical protein